MKKTPGDIIILHKCTINDNHMMYCSWDMKCDRQNFLSFWTVFLLFYPWTTRKIKIKKNEKKSPGGFTHTLHHFTHVYQKWQSYDVWFLRYGAWQITLSFWTIFYPFTPLKIQTIKILKKRQKHLEISSF